MMRIYVNWLNIIYKLYLNKLNRKAGTKRMVYKKRIGIFIFKNRLRAGIFNLRVYSKNILFYSFLTFLVFFNFIVLFNFRFTITMNKKTLDFSQKFIYLQKKKSFQLRRRQNMKKYRYKLI